MASFFLCIKEDIWCYNLMSGLIITDGVIISDSPFLNFAPKECRKIREKFFYNLLETFGRQFI